MQELLLNGPALTRRERVPSHQQHQQIAAAGVSSSASAKTRTDPTEKLLAFLDPDYKYPVGLSGHFDDSIDK